MKLVWNQDAGCALTATAKEDGDVLLECAGGEGALKIGRLVDVRMLGLVGGWMAETTQTGAEDKYLVRDRMLALKCVVAQHLNEELADALHSDCP